MRLIAALTPRRGAVYGGAAVLLVLLTCPRSPPVFGGEPKAGVVPELAPRDWILTNQARRALQKDEKLAALRMGVSVKDKVATIWGTIPTPDAARHAEELLKKISGIASVVNDCRVVPTADPVPQAVADAVKKSKEGGTDVEVAAKPPLPTAAPTARVTSAKPAEPLGQPPPGDPAELLPRLPIAPPSSAPPAVLLNPVPSGPDPAPEVPDTMENVRRSDPRFKDVVLEKRGGVVKINGSVNRMKDAMDLAERLNSVPGVRQVILGSVQEK